MQALQRGLNETLHWTGSSRFSLVPMGTSLAAAAGQGASTLSGNMRMELTSTNLLSVAVMVWLAFGGLLFASIWFITRHLRAPWLRNLLRAFVLAVVFTPTLMYAPGTLSQS